MSDTINTNASRAAEADDPCVSLDDEPLIVVDDDDQVLGHETKVVCHNGQGLLHRAFSVFLFDQQGRVLLQQRSRGKRLWGGFWSNACCSHPRRREVLGDAVRRRCREELNVEPRFFDYLFQFRYQAPFGEAGSEHELCSVFVGRHEGPVRESANEIAEVKVVPWQELERDLEAHPARYAPWMETAWARMRRDFCSSRP
jgi:isopentenyl-diphosphate Delta-isomerase